MNKLYFSILLLFSFTLFVTSCDDEMPTETIDFEYQAEIRSPSTEDKKVGESIHIHVDFESLASKTIHHINVKIYNKLDPTQVIYNKPEGEGAHVHAEEGEYGYHADFDLTAEEGVTAHSDWILEAKVWGHEAGLGEVVESIEFHVHPE